MEDKELKQTIQDKLSHHRVDVPDDLWARVSGALPSPIAWYKRKSTYVAAATLAALVLALWWLYDDTAIAPQDTGHSLYTACDTAEEVISPIELPIVPNVIIAEHVKQATPEPKIQSAEKAPTAIQQAPVVQEVLVAEAAQPQDSSITESSTTCDESLHCCLSDSACRLFNDPTAPCYDDIAINHIKKSGITSDRGSLFFAFHANTSTRNTVVTPYAYRCNENEMTFVHRMPFSMRALLEKRFGRWGVGAGLAYTYMAAEYESSDNVRKGLQQLHYVGVPLYVSYEFARVGKFAFYTAFGGQLDINTAGVQHETDGSIASKYFEDIEFRDELLQLSLQLRVGAAYEIVEHIDIFVEPVVGYYFDNDSKIHSRWQDSQWNTSLGLGIRAWL